MYFCVAKRQNASLISDSVAAVMLCSFARADCRAFGAGLEACEGGGAARLRGGCHEISWGVAMVRWMGGSLAVWQKGSLHTIVAVSMPCGLLLSVDEDKQ